MAKQGTHLHSSKPIIVDRNDISGSSIRHIGVIGPLIAHSQSATTKSAGGRNVIDLI